MGPQKEILVFQVLNLLLVAHFSGNFDGVVSILDRIGLHMNDHQSGHSVWFKNMIDNRQTRDSF